MSNVARDIIWPSDENVRMRVVFLHVGQGDCTLVLVKDGDTYRTLVIDINRDEKNGGVDVPRLVKDLVEEEGGKLGVFVNTHPHNDHLGDVLALSDEVDIQEVWHSGHKPGKEHDDSYQNLKKVIDKVTKKHGAGAETVLEGSRSSNSIGEAEYHVLAPAKHVTDEIEDETPKERYRRIHEQCAVLKFGKDDTWVMIDGDADRDAWEKHITDYHKDRLKAQILSAAHHGSRTFFKYQEEDESYLDALQHIEPEYVVIQAPTSDESPHGHPHESAIKHYEDEVGKDNVLHTGKNRECFICDVFTDGTYSIDSDTQLIDEYGLAKKKAKAASIRVGAAPAVVSGTRIDQRPMG